MKTFTNDSVRAEANEENLLVIFKGKVYDLTDFSLDHPGGKDVLMEFCGKDISDVMDNDSFHKHSEVAYDMMSEFLVGEIASYDGNVALSSSTQTTSTSKKQLFDHSKPLYPQLLSMNISKKEYIELVHVPHHSKESFRFFENDFMELLSRTHWWVVPLVWLPVIYIMLSFSIDNYGSTGAYMLFALGVFTWTVVEYTLHRFLFHLDENLPDYHIFIVLHFTLHGVHHYFPMDKLRLVFPPAMALILVSCFYGLFRVVLPASLVIAIMSGALFGYVLYDLCHYYVHHGVPITEHLRYLKRYHMDHHYKNYHLGYGITSTLWDKVFTTKLDTK